MTICQSCMMASELTEGARCKKCIEYLLAAERERCAKVLMDYAAERRAEAEKEVSPDCYDCGASPIDAAVVAEELIQRIRKI